MPKLRKSPLSAGILKDNPITPRVRNVVDLNLLQQKAMAANNKQVRFNFHSLLNGCDKRKLLVYRLAKALEETLKDNNSVDSEYGMHSVFLKYSRYCIVNELDPFSKEGFLSYCGLNGELQRRVSLANKPLPYAYLYQNGSEIGLSENSAGIERTCITTYLKRVDAFCDKWLRDSPSFKGRNKPTAAYSQNEYTQIIRRLNFIFFSVTSQLIASKEKGVPLESVEAIFDELDNGNMQTITFKNNPKQTGIVDLIDVTSPFNIAMLYAYYLFCHYTSLNSSSILNICHPIVESEHKKANRTTSYVIVKAWKGRAKKVMQGTFVESAEPSNREELPLEVDKSDGLTFINTLKKLSLLFNPEFNKGHPPLFYLLTRENLPAPITSMHLQQGARLLACYTDNRIHHAPYLIECFFDLLDNNTITKVIKSNSEVGKVISKEKRILLPNAKKQWTIAMAYASLRALTDIPLKGIYMPLNYSDVDRKGNVKVSFLYNDGQRGKFTIEARYVEFLKKLEEFSEQYNSSKRSKLRPNQKLTPYLIPLGTKYKTYQWDTVEYPIAEYLRHIGIFSGDYLLDLTAKRIRSTASNSNIDLTDGGLSVATSLLQNQIGTLKDHYLSGDITQNQVIASQAVDILHEYVHCGSLEDAKTKVKEARKIKVLEYDNWKTLRMPTNPNGMLCSGEPTGEARGEHRASQRRANEIVGDDIKLQCYQYDKCLSCQSAKLVNDESNAYKLLSFIELLEDSIDLMPEREEELSQRANELMELAEQNLSRRVLNKAEDKLANEGRYFLHNEDFLQTIMGVNCHV